MVGRAVPASRPPHQRKLRLQNSRYTSFGGIISGRKSVRQNFGEAFSDGGSPAKILGKLFPTAEAPPKFWGSFFRRKKSHQKLGGTSFGRGNAAQFLKLPILAVLSVIWRNWFRLFVTFSALRGDIPVVRHHRRERRLCRSIRVSGFSLTFAVSFWVWFLGCLWLAGFIVHVEHVERVVARGLFDDEHEA